VSQTLNVHVRVNDADTGKPTPVRIRFGGPDGEYFAPLGRPAEFPVGRGEDVGGHLYLNQKRYAYIDGGCEVPLPTGVPLSVEITKGPAYIPIRETITLGEGQLTLRFSIRRWTSGPWSNLYSVDTRCHFLTPHSARLEAAAEGLDLVNLLATVQDYRSEDGHRYRIVPNLTAFSGQAEALPGVVVNTFNVHPTLGRLALLHCHRPVYPLTFGHMDETDDWSLSDWCDQCHRKKGLVVWCDAYRPDAGLPGGESLVNAVLGKIDAIEIDTLDRAAPFLPLWYRLLNAGLRLPIVGGSGKDRNRVPLGGVRTLTPANADSRSYAEWVEQVRAGRTVAGNGPFVRLSVNGEPFATRLVQVTPAPLRLIAEAASVVPFERLELISNGEVIHSTPATVGDVRTARLEVELTLPDGGWVAVRCWGPARSELYPHAPVFAHTSPTFVQVAGRPTPRKQAAVAGLGREVEAVRHWIESAGRFTNPRRKEHLLSLCDAATSKLAGQQ
jgi:hypothetical protein